MNLNAKLASLMARKQKGIAIWVIILVVALIVVLGVALSAGSTTGKSDLAQQKRAESLAATVLQQGFAVESAIGIALAEGKTLDIDAATGVVTDPTNDLTDKDNTFDFAEIGLNAAPVVPAAAQDGITTPVVDYRFVQEGTAKFIAGDVRIDVCEQANAKTFGAQYVLGTSVADLNTTTGLIEVDVDGDGTADILNATGGCDSNGVADDLNTTVATTAVGGVYYKKLN